MGSYPQEEESLKDCSNPQLTGIIDAIHTAKYPQQILLSAGQISKQEKSGVPVTVQPEDSRFMKERKEKRKKEKKIQGAKGMSELVPTARFSRHHALR